MGEGVIKGECTVSDFGQNGYNFCQNVFGDLLNKFGGGCLFNRLSFMRESFIALSELIRTHSPIQAYRDGAERQIAQYPTASGWNLCGTNNGEPPVASSLRLPAAGLQVPSSFPTTYAQCPHNRESSNEQCAI